MIKFHIESGNGQNAQHGSDALDGIDGTPAGWSEYLEIAISEKINEHENQIIQEISSKKITEIWWLPVWTGSAPVIYLLLKLSGQFHFLED